MHVTQCNDLGRSTGLHPLATWRADDCLVLWGIKLFPFAKDGIVTELKVEMFRFQVNFQMT
jgi:hypothetical protein